MTLLSQFKDQKYNKSVWRLLSLAASEYEKENYSSSLDYVSKIVEIIITDPLCTAKVFASKELDALCQSIGAKNFRHVPKREISPSTDKDTRKKIGYILSRGQNSGGHLLLMKNYIKAQPNCDHRIFITGVGGTTDLKYLEKTFDANNNVSIFVCPEKVSQRRLTWLQEKLVSSNLDYVYLLNHHHDSVAVAAIVPEMNLDGAFIHHADHHLCLGVHLTHLDHIDFHPMGYHHCRSELGIDNKYIPLSVEDQGGKQDDFGADHNKTLITATVARSNKVEIPYHISYLDLVPDILNKTGGRHVHIGKLSYLAVRQIRKKMKSLALPEDRFVYIKWTPNVWKCLQENKVDIYISSFPYAAGLTLIEVMGAGIPVIMHRHVYSRILSGIELAYPEAFSWAYPQELLDYLGDINSERLNEEKTLSRQRYDEYHHPKALELAISEGKYTQKIPDLNENINVRLDEWAYWVCSQRGIYKDIYRTIYRFMRKIRSKYF